MFIQKLYKNWKFFNLKEKNSRVIKIFILVFKVRILEFNIYICAKDYWHL